MTTGKATFRASNSPQGLTENMQILTGQKGDRLDKALTLREAAALGMVNLRRNGAGQIVPELPPATTGDPEWSGVQQPVAPTGVTADGAFHTVTLVWDAPAYNGHAFAEVWRAQENNLAKAVRVGTTLANVYSDATGKGFKAFYWVRFVNKNSFAGPYQSTGGIPAETSRDVDSIIASANNFAIYNPAKPDQKEIIFGVTDDGKVAIREAVIKAATIQILKSEKITADYIKAGVSISSPKINGGELALGGRIFMDGGAAGFGLNTTGGGFSGWDKQWNTIIYANGTIRTNSIQAEGGYVKNMTINNCTIEADCTVKGTIYAERIVGDVTAVLSLNRQVPSTAFNIGFRVAAAPFTRRIVISGIQLKATGYVYGSGGAPSQGTRSCVATCRMNGVSIGIASAIATGYAKDSSLGMFSATIPAWSDVGFSIEFKGDIAVDLTGAVAMVFKADTGTFYGASLLNSAGDEDDPVTVTLVDQLDDKETDAKEEDN